MKTKNPKKKTGAKPAKSKGKAKPAADADSVAPFSFPEWKADANGIIPAPPIPPPPKPGAKVDPWRDWARRIVSRCGWSWEALEENERQPCSREIVGWGGAVYWALAHAVKLPPARLDEAAAELAGVLVAAAEKKDCDRFCTACNLFPETVRRLAEAPADVTPPASPSNPNADAKGGEGAEDSARLAASAVKWKMREAVKTWMRAHAERNRIHRITRESREEKWGSFWNWVRAPGSGFRDVAALIEEEVFWRILDSVRHL